MTPTPYIIGNWIDNAKNSGAGFGYTGMMMLFFSFIALVSNILLIFWNYYYLDNVMNKKSEEIEKLTKVRKALKTPSYCAEFEKMCSDED